MNEDSPRPDLGQVDMPGHDQTPDMSLDTALSIREAAARAEVTEKTIRRWIKGGRLHAVKLGGQYRIPLADLERARDEQSAPVQTPDTERLDSGHPSPRVAMSDRLDTGHDDVQAQAERAPVDLQPLVDHIARLEREIGQLTEAATVWQVRARQAEEQLQQLTAGAITPQESVESPESVANAPQGVRGWIHRMLGYESERGIDR